MPSLFFLINSSLFAIPTSRDREHTPSCYCEENKPSLTECEAFNPAWYNMKCDCGIFLEADFLYWYGKECNLPYAEKFKNIQTSTEGNTPITLTLPRKTAYTEAKWAPGARAGIGWNLPRDGWELKFLWTGYWNTKSQKETAEVTDTEIPEIGDSGLYSIWLYPNTAADAQPDIWSKIKGKWEFSFSRFDLTLRRRYYVSRCFLFSPYAGLEAIWTNTAWTTTYFPREIAASGRTFSGKVKTRNKNWGVGFVGGIEPTWRITTCFSLLADLGFSLTWGGEKQTTKTRYNTATASDDLLINNKTGQSGVCLFPLLDAGLFLRYDTYFCHRQFHLAADFGWEHHVLLNHNMRVVPGDVIFVNGINFFSSHKSSYMSNDVVMGGLVLRARFDF